MASGRGRESLNKGTRRGWGRNDCKSATFLSGASTHVASMTSLESTTAAASFSPDLAVEHGAQD